MIGTWVMALAAFATGPEIGRVQLCDALGAFQRLAAAIPKTKPGANESQQIVHRIQKAELNSLISYLSRLREKIAIGKWDEAYRSNMLEAARQAVIGGKVFSALPEEALCWERVGLNFATIHRRIVQEQVLAGKLPTQVLGQADEAYKSANRRYNETLARCLTPDQ